MVADVNWMLGASVQSGAALVAIVGGLLGSRYVALDAEQQAAQRRLDDVTRRLGPARERATNAEDDLTEFRVSEIMDQDAVFDAIAQQRGTARLDEVLEAADLEGRGVPREALEGRLALLVAELEKAVPGLRSLVPVSEDPEEWETFRRLHRLEPKVDALWEWAYIKIARARGEKAGKARAEQQRVSSGFPMAVGYTPGLAPYQLLGASQHDAGWRTATANRLIRARDDAGRTLLQLEAEQEAARHHVADTAQPEGFGLALSVLAFIAVTTIAFPLSLMVSGPMTLPLWVRITVATAFLAGVGSLLRFLFVYAAYLRTGSERRSLPRSFLGLLRR